MKIACAGRPRTTIPIAGYINCSIDEDRERARREAATLIAFNATVSAYQGILRLHGFDGEAAQIRSAWETRDWEGMVNGVSEEMIDTIALTGTPDEVRERYTPHWAGLYETPLLWPTPFRGLDGVRAKRLARVDRADVAGGVLPGYDVGGDFFDYAANADGL